MTRIGIIVPEYRTRQAPGGGVATVADFVIDAIAADGTFEYEVVSPRMYHGAPESQRLLAPSSWFRGPALSHDLVRDTSVTYVGASWAELEPLRFRGSKALRRVLEQFDALVVVCGTPASFELVRGVNVPVLGQVATIVSEERRRLLTTGNIARRLVHRLNTAMVSRLDRSGVLIPGMLFVENPWMKDWSVERGAGHVVIELPGIDISRYTPTSINRSGYILSVGRLADPRKNLPLLIRAFGRAKSEHGISQKLVLAGRGSPPTEALEEVRRLGVQADVSIRSDVSFDELPALYQGADFFAMSSSEEGLGMVMMEAMASGLPVVSTATEGAKVVVGDTSTGRVIEFGEDAERQLTLALADYANDSSMRHEAGQAARRRAETVFAADQAGRRFVSAINAVIGAR